MRLILRLAARCAAVGTRSGLACLICMLALAEIAHQLPDVVLVPFPVVTDRQRVEPWWTDGVAARRMVTEYVKYVFVRLRMGLKPSAGSQGAS